MKGYLVTGIVPALLLGGCTSVDKNYVPVATQDSILVKARQFSEVPVPRGLKLIAAHNESGSFEAGNFKWGSFHYRGNALLPVAVDFIKDQMAQHRWDLVREEAPNGRERFLELVKERYSAEFSLRQVGKDLLMDVKVNTRYKKS